MLSLELFVRLAVLYSQLSLSGQLYKTDTSIRRTPGAGPGRFSVILLITKLSIRRTPP